jgi:hypothetical protein
MPIVKTQDDSKRWKQGLERIGVDQVRQMLRERPDRPRDEIFPNIFPDPPFPTRGFAQDWVLEQENRIFRLSKSMVLVIVAAVVVVLMAWFAASSLNNVLPQPPVNPPPALQATQQ